MTVSPEQMNNSSYSDHESYWMNGLLTYDGIEGGTSMICNVDDCSGDFDTYRQIDHEAKFSPNGHSIGIKAGQLGNKKVEQINNPRKRFVLWGYTDWTKRDSQDVIYVYDLGENVLSLYDTPKLVYNLYRPQGLWLSLSTLIYTTRQKYNKFANDWKKGKFDDFDLEKIRVFDYEDFTKKFYGINA